MMSIRVTKLLLFFILFNNCVSAQKISYESEITAFQKNYVDSHGVVKGEDKKYLLFFPVDNKYLVKAKFIRIIDSIGFDMNTSSGMKKKYFTYGLLNFKLNDTLVQLHIYQSRDLRAIEKYKDYLFIPFGDATTGFASYGGGRYLECYITDIVDGYVAIDFNKAYNPYCAYTTGFNCPIPPMENLLKISVIAGEMNYGKTIH